MAAYYLPLKHLHLLTVAISIGLLVLRFLWIEWRGRLPRILKIIPHINDTLLLAFGVLLTLILGWLPWLTPKLILIGFYIGAGVLAFRARSPFLRRTAFALALLFVALIILIARTKAPIL